MKPTLSRWDWVSASARRIAAVTTRSKSGAIHKGETGSRDEGSILLLLIGLCLIVLLIASVVTGITGVYLERQKLQALADRTASATVQNFAGLSGDLANKPLPVLTSAHTHEQAGIFLIESGAYTQFDQLVLAPGSGTADGTTGRVQLSAVAHPPLVSIIVPGGVPISATGTARITAQQ
ncbi:pilus assembly protein TadG-related protein [Rothia sp. ZJ1223]|uniref:pilus assembly protein TadG-related protein n=1 Tax=Rothia sp. ZJ1223 TaxID=2811098 RepID=UPI00195C0973|nr:pilus assembly protein TadG-related protein [Rothia sp. ZJ1223]MBM7051034.1 hypothetical protein [Rothia sp. ZJ1223]